MLSSGTGTAGFISITEPSKLAKKAIRRLNATWKSISSEPLLAGGSLVLVHMMYVKFKCDYTC